MIMVIMMTSRKISPMPRWRLSMTEESSEEPTLRRLLPLVLTGWTCLEIPSSPLNSFFCFANLIIILFSNMQVGVGKPYLYGLCAGGSEGVIKVGQSHFLFILAADFNIYMSESLTVKISIYFLRDRPWTFSELS